MLPGVSIVMPTYGRWAALQEAVASFVMQQYDGPRELIIGNDLTDQFIHEGSVPNVRTVNFLKRFPTLLEKREALASQAKYPWMLFWDSDDIYLPNHLALTVGQIHGNMRLAWRHPFMFVDYGGQTLVKKPVNAVGSLIVNRALFKKVGGMAGSLPCESRSSNPGAGTDLTNTLAMQGYLQTTAADYPRLAPTFIYRRDSVKHHLSNAYAGTPSERIEAPNGYNDVERAIFHDLSTGKEPSGELTLSPAWSMDWNALAIKSAKALGLSYE